MVTINTLNQVQVISLRGVINALTIPQATKHIQHGQAYQNIIVDLTDVSQLDSAGIAWIVRMLKAVRDTGGHAIMIWSKSDVANRIVRFTQFDKIFPVVSDIHTAIALV